MSLQFHVNIVRAKDRDETLKQVAATGYTAFLQSMRKRAMVIAGQADQPFRVAFQFIESHGRDGFLLGSQLRSRNQAAEVLVAGTSLDQERVVPSFRNADFSADVRFDSALFGRHVKTRRPVYTMPIQKGHRGQIPFCAASDKGLRQRSSFEKAESTARVQFDVWHDR
jgi:hypothetical protein